MDVKVEAFIQRWQGQDGTERANYQLFLTELCELLDLGKPDPASSDTEQNAYVFERRVDIKHPDGTENRGYIDLYKRDSFVLEAKQTGHKLATERWDKAMLRAQRQADTYIRALPAEEGRPPFLIVTDVGRSIELYSDFSRSGATYVPFPDPRAHRIRLEDLHNEAIRQRLTQVWSDPISLDPSRQSAKVTREIASQLAELAKSLEGKHTPSDVAGFLMRCLFTMFAEDVGLIANKSFTELLESLKETPEHFPQMLQGLWHTMNVGGFSPELRQKILKFNGGLFAEATALPLKKKQIELLIKSARADWCYVEPAIFGTLLERALNPTERHKLGAHYTPRAYVERLVLPTVIEPLREEWRDVQAVATALQQQGKEDKAVQAIQLFHHKLCEIRVLDPACGSANFLYVCLEHMKRLEGEILTTLEDIGLSQRFDQEGFTVDPHQFLGIEINPRAAKIAEMVLWIGYLQWHYRTQGNVNPPEPVLRDFHNIECRDAVLTYDSVEHATDEQGEPITQWDGKTTKAHPVTGKQVPDETAQMPVERYINPRKAAWPEADYVVGNPPFIGEKRMRDLLGDSYAETLRGVYSDLPACDFVMYWWHMAADCLKKGVTNRFGFITTNSITQTQNRPILDKWINIGVRLVFAIPDHPWVDASDGAQVRIAMTVAETTTALGSLQRVVEENIGNSDGHDIKFSTATGEIHPNLKVGVPLTSVSPLWANNSMVYQGVKLVGDGFLVSSVHRFEWCGTNEVSNKLLPQLVAGSDLTKRRPPRYCIDFFGLSAEEARDAIPQGYQQLLVQVKPMRENNSMRSRRDNWWIHGAPAIGMRNAIRDISRYIGTSEVSKHRFFVFLDSKLTLADGSLAVVASSNAFHLGLLSSRVHSVWALAKGGRMGVGNDPRWQNGPCFMSFAFLDANEEQTNRICQLAEQLDTHRKQRQAEHPSLTLTGTYNVLEKLRSGAPLTTKEKTIHEQGLVSVLKEIHDDLDRAVFCAYGWDDLAGKLVGLPGATTPLPDKSKAQAEAEEELLKRLVELNAQRAAEEAQGHIRWLRPEFQAPKEIPQTQKKLGLATTEKTSKKSPTSSKLAWPKELQQQIKVVRELLTATPMDAETLATHFKRKPVKGVNTVLGALEELGMVKADNKGIYSV